MGDISQSTQKTKSRVLAALDDSSVLSSSSSPLTTMQPSQTLKRKLLGDVPIVPGSRAQIIPDTAYTVLGPQSSFKKPRHACKRAANIRQLPLISWLVASANIAGGSSQGISPAAGSSSKTKDEIQTKLVTSGFSLWFDNETPVGHIDRGGPDQEQR